MAGYRRVPKTYVLKFEDYPGLEVPARGVSTEELLKILKLADMMTTAPDEGQVKELFAWFAKRLIGWNLEDEDGEPVPATLAGLLGEDFEFGMAMVMGWVQAISPGKSKTSSSGGTPPDPLEASIPMTTPASTAGT